MSIHKALLAAQSEMPSIPKARTVSFSGRSYKYADIADILKIVVPILNKHKVFFSQSVSGGLLTTVFTSELGEVDSSSIPFVFPDNITPQQMGSLLTYYRRYGLCAALGIAADEDDDGQHSSKPLASIQHSKNTVSYGTEHPPQEYDFDDFMKATAPREENTSTNSPISPKQASRLFAISKKAGWTDDAVKTLVRDVTGQESSKLIPWPLYDSIWKHIEANPI